MFIQCIKRIVKMSKFIFLFFVDFSSDEAHAKSFFGNKSEILGTALWVVDICWCYF